MFAKVKYEQIEQLHSYHHILSRGSIGNLITKSVKVIVHFTLPGSSTSGITLVLLLLLFI